MKDRKTLNSCTPETYGVNKYIKSQNKNGLLVSTLAKLSKESQDFMKKDLHQSCLLEAVTDTLLAP